MIRDSGLSTISLKLLKMDCPGDWLLLIRLVEEGGMLESITGVVSPRPVPLLPFTLRSVVRSKKRNIRVSITEI